MFSLNLPDKMWVFEKVEKNTDERSHLMASCIVIQTYAA